MTKTLMIIGAGSLQVPAIRRAREMGYRVMAVDRDADAPGMALADTALSISTNDIDGIVDAAVRLKPDGVMTLATDMPVRSCAAVAARLGLVGVSMDTAVRATDKGAMREALSAGNIAIPLFFICSSESEFNEAISHFHHEPFIVKPADSSGSRGVTLVTDPSLADAAYRYSLEFSLSGRVLVEEYMRGPEVSVETFSQDGTVHVLAITDKIKTPAPYFVELGHTIPSTLEESTRKAIEELAKNAVSTLGILQGPSHTEIMVTSSGPRIVEIGARLGGDHIASDLVPLATGIPLVDLTILQALNEPVVIPPSTKKAASIRYLTPAPGVVRWVSGIDEARKVAGVVQVEVDPVPGDRVGPVHNSRDRSGLVIAVADSAAEAGAICEKAYAMIQISTEAEDQDHEQ